MDYEMDMEDEVGFFPNTHHSQNGLRQNESIQNHSLKRKVERNDNFQAEYEDSGNDEVSTVSKKIKLMRLPASPEDLMQEIPQTLRITIKTLSGGTIDLNIEYNDTVQKIKERVEEIQGIPPDQQRLIFNGKTIAEDRRASDYHIVTGSVLHLVLALRGGAL